MGASPSTQSSGGRREETPEPGLVGAVASLRTSRSTSSQRLTPTHAQGLTRRSSVSFTQELTFRDGPRQRAASHGPQDGPPEVGPPSVGPFLPTASSGPVSMLELPEYGGFGRPPVRGDQHRLQTSVLTAGDSVGSAAAGYGQPLHLQSFPAPVRQGAASRNQQLYGRFESGLAAAGRSVGQTSSVLEDVPVDASSLSHAAPYTNDALISGTVGRRQTLAASPAPDLSHAGPTFQRSARLLGQLANGAPSAASGWKHRDVPSALQMFATDAGELLVAVAQYTQPHVRALWTAYTAACSKETNFDTHFASFVLNERYQCFIEDIVAANTAVLRARDPEIEEESEHSDEASDGAEGERRPLPPRRSVRDALQTASSSSSSSSGPDAARPRPSESRNPPLAAAVDEGAMACAAAARWGTDGTGPRIRVRRLHVAEALSQRRELLKEFDAFSAVFQHAAEAAVEALAHGIPFAPLARSDPAVGAVMDGLFVYEWSLPTPMARTVAHREAKGSRALLQLGIEGLRVPAVTTVTFGARVFSVVALAPLQQFRNNARPGTCVARRYDAIPQLAPCRSADLQGMVDEVALTLGIYPPLNASHEVHRGRDGRAYFVGNSLWLAPYGAVVTNRSPLAALGATHSHTVIDIGGVYGARNPLMPPSGGVHASMDEGPPSLSEMTPAEAEQHLAALGLRGLVYTPPDWLLYSRSAASEAESGATHFFRSMGGHSYDVTVSPYVNVIATAAGDSFNPAAPQLIDYDGLRSTGRKCAEHVCLGVQHATVALEALIAEAEAEDDRVGREAQCDPLDDDDGDLDGTGYWLSRVPSFTGSLRRATSDAALSACLSTHSTPQGGTDADMAESGPHDGHGQDGPSEAFLWYVKQQREHAPVRSELSQSRHGASVVSLYSNVSVVSQQAPALSHGGRVTVALLKRRLLVPSRFVLMVAQSLLKSTAQLHRLDPLFGYCIGKAVRDLMCAVPRTDIAMAHLRSQAADTAIAPAVVTQHLTQLCAQELDATLSSHWAVTVLIPAILARFPVIGDGMHLFMFHVLFTARMRREALKVVDRHLAKSTAALPGGYSPRSPSPQREDRSHPDEEVASKTSAGAASRLWRWLTRRGDAAEAAARTKAASTNRSTPSSDGTHRRPEIVDVYRFRTSSKPLQAPRTTLIDNDAAHTIAVARSGITGKHCRPLAMPFLLRQLNDSSAAVQPTDVNRIQDGLLEIASECTANRFRRQLGAYLLYRGFPSAAMDMLRMHGDWCERLQLERSEAAGPHAGSPLDNFLDASLLSREAVIVARLKSKATAHSERERTRQAGPTDPLPTPRKGPIPDETPPAGGADALSTLQLPAMTPLSRTGSQSDRPMSRTASDHSGNRLFIAKRISSGHSDENFPIAVRRGSRVLSGARGALLAPASQLSDGTASSDGAGSGNLPRIVVPPLSTELGFNPQPSTGSVGGSSVGVFLATNNSETMPAMHYESLDEFIGGRTRQPSTASAETVAPFQSPLQGRIGAQSDTDAISRARLARIDARVLLYAARCQRAQNALRDARARLCGELDALVFLESFAKAHQPRRWSNPPLYIKMAMFEVEREVLRLVLSLQQTEASLGGLERQLLRRRHRLHVVRRQRVAFLSGKEGRDSLPQEQPTLAEEAQRLVSARASVTTLRDRLAALGRFVDMAPLGEPHEARGALDALMPVLEAVQAVYSGPMRGHLAAVRDGVPMPAAGTGHHAHQSRATTTTLDTGPNSRVPSPDGGVRRKSSARSPSALAAPWHWEEQHVEAWAEVAQLAVHLLQCVLDCFDQHLGCSSEASITVMHTLASFLFFTGKEVRGIEVAKLAVQLAVMNTTREKTQLRHHSLVLLGRLQLRSRRFEDAKQTLLAAELFRAVIADRSRTGGGGGGGGRISAAWHASVEANALMVARSSEERRPSDEPVVEASRRLTSGPQTRQPKGHPQRQQAASPRDSPRPTFLVDAAIEDRQKSGGPAPAPTDRRLQRARSGIEEAAALRITRWARRWAVGRVVPFGEGGDITGVACGCVPPSLPPASRPRTGEGPLDIPVTDIAGSALVEVDCRRHDLSTSSSATHRSVLTPRPAFANSLSSTSLIPPPRMPPAGGNDTPDGLRSASAAAALTISPDILPRWIGRRPSAIFPLPPSANAFGAGPPHSRVSASPNNSAPQTSVVGMWSTSEVIAFDDDADVVPG